MADILIRGLDKPDRCFICPLKYILRSNYYCVIKDMQGVDACISINTMSVICPLGVLPDHGDLIDRDDLNKHRKQSFHGKNGWEYDYVEDSDIDNAPVVIPSSKEIESCE